MAHKPTRREELYRDFIEKASKLYADSLVRETSDISQLVNLYAMVSRMRVLSSTATVEHAAKVAQIIVNTKQEVFR